MTWMWVVCAFAQDFWSPNEVVSQSRQFGRAQDEAGAVAGRLEDGARATSLALEDAAQGLDVLAGLLPPGERGALSSAKAEYQRSILELQMFTDGWLERFDAVFVGARERALAGHPWTRCDGKVGGASRTPGFSGGSRDRCEGTDHSAEVAAGMDADPALRQGVEALLAEPWPNPGPPQITGAPVAFGGAPPVASVDVSAWLRAVVPEAMQAISERDELARARLAERGDADAEDIKALIADTVDARRETAAPWLELASATQLKKRGAPALAWCWVPARLGGCGLPDATDAAVGTWLADKKIARQLAR
jgi:hypothetical protein